MSELSSLDTDQPLLVAEGLAKNYGRLPACRDVSFALYPGEVLAIDLQAVLTGRSERIDWRGLQDPQRWQMGWT